LNPPAAPADVDTLAAQILAWLHWGALLAGVIGLLACVAMVVVGHRRRVGLAQDGVVGSLWVLTGLTLASLSAVVAGAFAGMTVQ
jgi:hypothetical protein